MDHRNRCVAQRPVGWALVALTAALAGCGGKGEALSKTELGDDAFANVPAPPAEGPKLVALKPAKVMSLPTPNGKALGELSLGGAVARSREPVSKGNHCDGGWYAVRPRGFVCADANVTLDERASKQLSPAAVERALPYRYGRAKVDNVPLYARAPTLAEQLEAEPELAKRPPKPFDHDPLGAAANDVPLDARAVATGPAVLLPGGEGIESGRRTTASFFTFANTFAAPATVPAAFTPAKAGSLKRGGGVALGAAITTAGPGGTRRFGVTPDGLLVPLDRLKPALGTTWHGIDLEAVGLPVAFVHKQGVHAWGMHKGKAQKRDDELERHASVALSGKFRTVEGVKYHETREGDWLRAQDIVLVVRRTKLPEFARGKQKWLDVSVANQTLTMYEGNKPLYATLVSTGRDQLKDPATTASTPRGAFRVIGKAARRSLDARETQGFEANDAPWALDLEGGGQIVGNYWSEGVGEANMFHAIALTPIDAHRVWTWTDPQLPDGWTSTDASAGEGTIVNVRP